MRTAIAPPWTKGRCRLPAGTRAPSPPCALALAAAGAAGLAAGRRLELRRQPGELPLAHLLHHLRHLLAGGEKLVHLLDARAAAPRDPRPARAVDEVRDAPLLRGHREDDRLDPGHLL